MVSFSCENCGDVLTKKKLDPHRNQCRGATYTCLDCMEHFPSTSYRTHTSCISEAQKYQGSTYKEKKGNKHSRNNSRTDLNAQALVPRQAYVQDEIDEFNGAVAVVDAPPRAPSPPVMPNVFDFLVEDATPNASRLDVSAPEESHMITDGREDRFEEEHDQQALVPRGYHTEERMPGQYDSQDHYAADGFSYGHAPVQPSLDRFDSAGNLIVPPSTFKTPAPKPQREALRNLDSTVSKKKSGSEKKRKRSPSQLDLSLVRAQDELDAVMTDAPPELHTGLTGGLNRLLRGSEFPPSPDYSGGDWAEASPLSPAKRSKKANTELRDRGRDREPKPRKNSGNTTITTVQGGQLVKIRRRERPREDPKRRSRRSVSASSNDRSRSPRPRRQLKRIEYKVDSNTNGSNGDAKALVLHRNDNNALTTDADAQNRADLFLSFINKGPDSERGCSINKVLKRFHRERCDRYDNAEIEWGGGAKVDEEKELWKNLRLRKNDRGEVVLFFGGGGP